MLDLDDPYPWYAQLREVSPVHRLGDSSFYVVSSWELISEVVARNTEFSSNLTATIRWQENGTAAEFPIAALGSPLHVLATADDPIHRVHRKLVTPSLTAKRIRKLEPFIAATFRQLWNEGLNDGHIDWVQAVGERLPMAVVVELLGLPDHDVDELIRWAFASTTLLDGVFTPTQLTEATTAVSDLAAYLGRALDAALEEPADNALGDLARLVANGRTDHDTAVMILVQLVAAGAESTISLLGTSVWLLGQHADVTAQLRVDHDLVAPFVEEALRLESPFRGHFRHVVTGTTLGELPLPAGSHLYLAWGAANRDPQQFDNPDAISLTASTRRSHMAFGTGNHLCVGAALARLESRIGIDFLLNATSGFHIDPSKPQWLRSMLSRRLETLPMTIRPS